MQQKHVSGTEIPEKENFMSANGNQIVALCLCGEAAKERIQVERGRFEDVWTMSIGVVAMAKKQGNIRLETCCKCSGHADEIGGFAHATQAHHLALVA